MPDNTVKKALSPEEEATISNIQSLCSELLASSQAQEEQPEMVQPETATMQEGAPPPDEEEKKKEEEGKMTLVIKEAVKKALEETPSDSATGSDDAETRIEDIQTDMTLENVDEVTKAVMSILKQQKAKKSFAPDAHTKILSDVVQIAKSQQEEMSEIKKTLNGILEGFGIASQIEIAQKSQTAGAQQPGAVQASQPIMAPQNDQVLELLKDLTGKTEKSKVDERFARNSEVRKTLRKPDVLTGLIGHRQRI